jgi:hypothetical protein
MARNNLQKRLLALQKKQLAAQKKIVKARIAGLKRLLRPAQPRVPKPKPKVPPLAVQPPAVQQREKGRPANNTTCDIYHTGNTPPAAPDVAGEACALIARFPHGQEASEGDTDFEWTHILTLGPTVDIRDAYPDVPDSRVYIPTKADTGFDIVFVELVNRGTPAAYKRVYLDRRSVTWPSDEV